MVVIPAGSFLMGSPSSEQGRYEHEGPQHRVTIANQFALGKTEVTVGEFKRFVNATGYTTDAERDVQIPTVVVGDKTYFEENENGCFTHKGGLGWHDGADWRNPDFTQADSHPVVCISWNDAKAYSTWLSEYTGQSYRLPSEAEWEYVARDGNVSAYPWGRTAGGGCVYANGGDEALRKAWNIKNDVEMMECDDGFVFTASVAHYAANAFGLHDMIGNAWEWTEDCGNSSYSGAPTDGSAWTRGDCSSRVLRGGSWSSYPRNLRAANRGGSPPSNRNGSGGFRLARTL
jgi:formylglycine-generating enzyme required for sulfatase activity